MGDYGVELINDSMQEFYVHFKGPKDSPYEGGVWKVHVELPEGYPYKSPSVVGREIREIWGMTPHIRVTHQHGYLVPWEPVRVQVLG